MQCSNTFDKIKLIAMPRKSEHETDLVRQSLTLDRGTVKLCPKSRGKYAQRNIKLNNFTSMHDKLG